MGTLRSLSSRLTASVSRGRSLASNFVITPTRAGLLRYSRRARPHALMHCSCRLAFHLVKWLYPLTGFIHSCTSCLLVLIGTLPGGTYIEVEAKACICFVPHAKNRAVQTLILTNRKKRMTKNQGKRLKSDVMSFLYVCKLLLHTYWARGSIF